ncbi:septum site-determining protein MinC [Desulfonispora thiosulfatigenes DSM 11270]|uniref:Probable septum site-determining protein MinC n=1 Tax=Desulfonispora thiosulfatigenes DSM 11270 TaxID=656914 RepID=A0A1W1VFK9_DESTI|nr:septum site-determining protein MinC [Desulfonispora thiosulfatigenes]SMB92168.1 septum site-determining protein MinC [Desulfonispora thiosulfatigenes DSM 11270]
MEAIEFKGKKEGVFVLLDCSLEFDYLCNKITEKIKNADSFLGKGMEIIISLHNTDLNMENRNKLKSLFESLDLIVKKIIPPIEENIINISEKIGVFQDIIEDEDSILTNGPTLVLKKSLRSGQNISHNGTIIIFGDVNPGAEVVAEGHIIVIGALRGIAHAGVKGNDKAIVFAFRLQPTQLRIAEIITRAPDGDQMIPNDPEVARIKDKRVIIEKYA